MASHVVNLPQIAQQVTSQTPSQQAGSTNQRLQPSKFAQKLETHRAQAPNATNRAEQIQVTQRTDQAQSARPTAQVANAQKVAKGHKTDLAKSIGKLFSDVERGSNRMTDIMNQVMSGKKFSPQELLVLQAEVYHCTMEMDALSKGLTQTVTSFKDTMKTQV
jgi:hypothetical protein